jgi:hypothetical protein
LNVGDGLRRMFLPLGMLMESITDFLLALFNCGEPGVDKIEVHQWVLIHGRRLMMMMMMMMTHVWTMKACHMVVKAPCKESHASPLDVA